MKRKLILCALGAAAMAPCANAAGIGDSDKTTVNNVAPATFEDLGLAPDSYWCGNADDEDYDFGSFRSGGFEFPNFYMQEYGTWAWYAYSSITANNGTSYMDQFQSAPGGGHCSDTFGLAYVDAYMGPSKVSLVDTAEGQVLSGMWLTNSAWTHYCILNGDGLSGPFETGDYLKVIVTGYDQEDEKTGYAEYYLADYRSENTADHYAVDKWTWMDLASLGAISRFEISMETTKSNAYGPTTPMYVCIDDVNTSEMFGTGVKRVSWESTWTVSAGNGFISIENPDAYLVSVFAFDGRKIIDTTYREASISIPAGLYIVSDGRNAFKVMVR